MLQGAKQLGDDVDKWLPEFKNDIHGVILVTGGQQSAVDDKLNAIKSVFNLNTGKDSSISQGISITGDVRTADGQKGHEQSVISLVLQIVADSHVQLWVS